MNLEERLKTCCVDERDGDFHIAIDFNRLERKFTEDSRVLLLYSNIKYSCEDFHWDAVLPTVRIPYRDPALGFLLDGTVFSSVGIYQRAPGVVMGTNSRTIDTKTIEEPKVDIVTARNSTLALGYQRNGLQITFSRKEKKQHVPIGVFLKAMSGLPYKVLLDRIAYKSQQLMNGFPCEIPESSSDLSKVAVYGAGEGSGGDTEPSIEACVDKVYNAIGTPASRLSSQGYSVHWKMNRIHAYLNSLNFKTVQNYEAKLSIANRAVGTYLNENICLEIYEDDGSGYPKVSEFRMDKGHFITVEDARALQKLDIHTLRVRTSRGFILQEDTPVMFRAKGYKLAQDVPELHELLKSRGQQVDTTEGVLIDDEILDALNESNESYLEVYTPSQRKTLHRSRDRVTEGDFLTIVNYLCTDPYISREDFTQYEVGNRIVRDYVSQVGLEVEQTYADIVNAIVGATDLDHVLESLPQLPSSRLCRELRNSDNKDVTQSDITNIMSRTISDTKSSTLLKEAPAAMMPVQKGQYGRLDALHSPDSAKVGSVQHMTALARVNPDTGEVEAPYEVVENGKPTGKIVYISAAAEANKYIVAWNEDLSNPTVMARYNDDVTTVDSRHVDYRDASPFCDMSVSRMCIPFPGFSQPKRAIMATKMNGQAVPVLHPERPLVSTGAETEIAALYYTGRQILEAQGIAEKPGVDLEIVNTTWGKIMVTHQFLYGDTTFEFSLPFTCTDKESLYNYNVNLNTAKAKTYTLDDVVFYNQSCDLQQYDLWERMAQGTLPLVKDPARPAMALGVNLRMCYKTYGTSTIDDAVLISDRLIADKTLSSVQIIRYEVKLKAGETFSATGNAKLHSYVYAGQPVISIYRQRNSGTTERSLTAHQAGEVVYVDIDSAGDGTAEVWVSTIHDAAIGDKVAGRYGNKSVIARIVPAYMMPYDPADGIPIDIVCSPLGLPSRMNLGQVLEVALGATMSKQGKCAVVTPFYPGIKDDITKEYEGAGLSPRRLFNPVYGKLTERPVMVGVLYFMKLEQMSNLKDAALGYPMAVDAVFGTPVESLNRPKGQKIGEQESWALNAAGASNIINNMFTYYSGDEENRKRYFNMLMSNRDTDDDPWDEYEGSHEGFGDGLQPQDGTNINSLVTQTVLRMFGLDLAIDEDAKNYKFLPLNMAHINNVQTLQNVKDDSKGFGEYAWSKAELEAPVINPFWVEYFPLGPILGMKSVKSLANGQYYIHRQFDIYGRETMSKNKVIEQGENLDDYMTGVAALIEVVRNTTLAMAENFLLELAGGEDGSSAFVAVKAEGPTTTILDEDGVPIAQDDYEYFPEVPMNVADLLKFIRSLKANGMDLNDLIWTEFPILPYVFRQPNSIGKNDQGHSFQKHIVRILSYSTSQEVYQGVREFVGYGQGGKEDWQTIRGYFLGKDSQSGNHGTVRGSVLSKRIGMSGRTVITPPQDQHMSPFFIGLPWRIAVVELGRVLAIRLKKREESIGYYLETALSIPNSVVTALEIPDWEVIVESLYEFNPYTLRKYFKYPDDVLIRVYNHLRYVVRGLIEGDVTDNGLVKYQGQYIDPRALQPDATIDAAVVMFGRQPTLHKKSLRTYFVKLVEGHSTQIHPTVCKGYNADFDGDTMWTTQLLGSMKVEACNTISVLQDLISEKDGSYTLELSQDVALGIYCATTFKNNSQTFEGHLGDYVYFDDVEELRAQLEYGDLHYYQATILKHGSNYYCSTAGRILVNAAVPGFLTQGSFTDPAGIAKSVLGDDVDLSLFRELKYDTIWTTTGTRPKGRENAVKLGDVQLEAYELYGDRESIMVTQRLYEIGMVASDVYSVSITLDDMHVDTSYDGGDLIEDCMKTPRETVGNLNSLYRMGLISEEQRKTSAIKAWDNARKEAQGLIMDRLNPASNTFYMMYSGARGSQSQAMQTVGFVGTISKTTSEDIEYPVLRGYGQGLTSLDLSQTRYSARIGVISTQAGTKDTGYATRQTVYMTSGLNVEMEDCSEMMPPPRNDAHEDTRYQNSSRVRLMTVEYGGGDSVCIMADGKTCSLEELVGDIYLGGAVRGSQLAVELGRRANIVDENIVDLLRGEYDLELEFNDHGKCKVGQPAGISPIWRQKAVAELYSYALPFTVDMKITDATVDWIEEMGLKEVVAFPKAVVDDDEVFHLEAYLPVDYDTSQYTLATAGEVHGDELMFTKPVSSDSDGFIYYERLLEDGKLTSVALAYLTKKRVAFVKFTDGTVTNITYKLSAMFKDLVIGRYSEGLPALRDHHLITKTTLSLIERYQLKYIPVYTGITCLCQSGYCSRCYGLSLSTKKLLPPGTNLGIAASQAMCEPLSQSTLNVGHSGGQRGAGTGKLSGLKFFTTMLKGKSDSNKAKGQMEMFAPCDGYVVQNPHNRNFIQVVKENGEASEPFAIDNADRLNVPNGAYVHEGDTLVAGTPDINRHTGTYIFGAALKTRLMMIKEYYKIFSSLDVSIRNAEVLARAQTSNCYALRFTQNSQDKVRDTAFESVENTGNYRLRVSTQAETVLRYTGVAAFAFENTGHLLAASVFNPGGLGLNSFLGNLITGTDVGSTEAKFLPQISGRANTSTRVRDLRNNEYRQRKVIGSGNADRFNQLALEGDSYHERVAASHQMLVGSPEEQRAALLGAGSSGVPATRAPASIPELLASMPPEYGDGVSTMNLGGPGPVAPPINFMEEDMEILGTPSDEEVAEQEVIPAVVIEPDEYEILTPPAEDEGFEILEPEPESELPTGPNSKKPDSATSSGVRNLDLH